MAPRLRSASALHNVLPEEALRVVFLALPVDARARAACVCRSWRAFLADPALWSVVDLTPAGGGAAARVTENLVRGAVARAAGHLRVLRLNRMLFFENRLLVDVIVNHGAELQEVNTDGSLTLAQLKMVFAAAPRLQVLNANVYGLCAALLAVMRKDPPFGPLRIDTLETGFYGHESADDVRSFAASVASHESLRSLRIQDSRSAAGLNALVDAATERRVEWLVLGTDCVFHAENAPALARLLRRGSITMLDIFCANFPHAPEESLPVLCAALRECHTLTRLRLSLNPLGGADRRSVTELLDAVAAMPALWELDLTDSRFQDPVAAGHSLGALLRANLPSLSALWLHGCRLGDDGLAAVLDGLTTNTRLRFLDCEAGNAESRAFYRGRLKPALEALSARAAVARAAEMEVAAE